MTVSPPQAPECPEAQKRARQRSRRWRTWQVPLIVFVLSFGLAETVHRSGVLEPLDYLYTDLWHVLAGQRFTAEHVVMVTIDDQTLAAHTDQPLAFWSPLFAKATSNLRKAGVQQIGIDFLFAISPENWVRQLDETVAEILRDYDLNMRQELNAGGVVLVGTSSRAMEEGQPDQLVLPQVNFLYSVPDFDLEAHIGLADLIVDGDGAVRRFNIVPDISLAKEEREGAPRFSLSALLALRHLDLPLDADKWQFGTQEVAARDILPISFVGPPGSIPTVSMSALLDDDALRLPAVTALAGKVVIIGALYSGMGDVHFTPYSRSLIGNSGNLMPGPEIQANVLETLLSGKLTQPLARHWQSALLVAVLLLATFGFVRTSPWQGFVLLLVFLLLPLAIGLGLFRSFQLWSPAYIQLGVIAAFMLAFGQRLTGEAREKARIRGIFDRYVSDTVVDLLVDSDELPDLGGKTVTITILFSDIRNFTTISEALEAAEVVEMLNEYFERVCKPILDNGGTIDKFIGDAVMVQFGAPLHFPDHARRAIQSAFAMGEAAEEFAGWMRDRFPDRELPVFSIGIGMHTGDAVVGNIGSRRRSEYTAIGDAVNLASRLEGVTKQMGCQIVASRATLDAAGPGVRTGRSEVLSVKGRAEQVEAVEIIAFDEE